MRRSFQTAFFVLIYAAQTGSWLRLFGGYNPVRAGGQATVFSATGNSNPVLLGLNILVIAVTLIVCFPKLPDMFEKLQRLKWLAGIYAFSALSIIWSASRLDTFRTSIYLVAGLFQFAYIGLYISFERMLELIGDFTAVGALLCFPAQLLLTSVDVYSPGYSGLFGSKNETGSIMVIGIIALIVRQGRWTFSRVAKLVLCVTWLLLSQSITAYIGMAVCLATLAYLRGGSAARLWMLIVGVCLVILVPIFIPNFYSLFLESSGKTTSLTGRDVIWPYSFENFLQRPILGWGYLGFWMSHHDQTVQTFGWDPGHAQSGFLEVALEEGLVGLGLLLAVLSQGVRHAQRQMRMGDSERIGLWMLTLSVFLIVRNFSETDFYRLPLWLVYVASFVALARIEFGWFRLHGTGEPTEGPDFRQFSRPEPRRIGEYL